MDMAIRKARDARRHISYFGPEANDFSLLEHTFIDAGRRVKAGRVNICIPMMKPYRGVRFPGTFTRQPLRSKPVLFT